MAKVLKNPVSISSDEIIQIINLRESKEFLKKRLESVEDDLKSAESQVIDSIEIGAQVPEGFSLLIKSHERRYPAWKEHFINQVGIEAADAILKNTPATTYKSLIIKPGSDV